MSEKIFLLLCLKFFCGNISFKKACNCVVLSRSKISPNCSRFDTISFCVMVGFDTTGVSTNCKSPSVK